MMMSRQIKLKIESSWMDEGMGARVRRSIGRSELRNLDPFLLLDEFRVEPPAGFPDHPHRGFETVTYLLSGKVRHEDFLGNKGEIGPGDLQWMTAGRGVVHCEMPGSKEASHGLQLWVNLAKEFKMIEPSWQDLLSKDIPVARMEGTEVKVIAGQCKNVKSPVYTRTPTFYLDFTVKPGASFEQETEPDWTVFAYTLSGQINFSDQTVPAHYTVVFDRGTSVKFENRGREDARFVLIGGRPIGESIVQYGPFVMNTQAEIEQARKDYMAGRNGFEGAREWNSSYAD